MGVCLRDRRNSPGVRAGFLGAAFTGGVTTFEGDDTMPAMTLSREQALKVLDRELKARTE